MLSVKPFRVTHSAKSKFKKIEAPIWEPYQQTLFPPRKPVNKYRPYSAELDDETELTFGPHAGLKLAQVPASWLLDYHRAPGIKNGWLMAYIELRLQKLILSL